MHQYKITLFMYLCLLYVICFTSAYGPHIQNSVDKFYKPTPIQYDSITDNLIPFNNYIKWDKNELTYKILNVSKNYNQYKFEKAVDNSFKRWIQHTSLNIKKSQNNKKTDITISFYNSKNNELAHSYYPPDGEIKINNKYQFSFDEDKPGISFDAVLTHEIGHVLGVFHNNLNQSSIMFPFNNRYNGELSIDDIKIISTLYPKEKENVYNDSAVYSVHLECINSFYMCNELNYKIYIIMVLSILCIIFLIINVLLIYYYIKKHHNTQNFFYV